MIPDTLAERDQWICWRTECHGCGERLSPTTKKCPGCGDNATKKPINPHTGGFTSTKDPDTWSSLSDAREYDSENPDTDGLGFVFTGEGIIAGVDLDDCRNPETGEIDEWAKDVVNRLDSFTEVSPSGTGLHVYVVGFLPDGGNRSKVGDGEIEMYEKARYFTVAGDHLDVTPAEIKQRNNSLSEVHGEYVADDGGGDESDETTTEPPEPTDIEDSDLLIETAKNADDGGKFKRLWNGNTSGYESHSNARMALLCKLAFYTGGDKQQMDSLFQESGLYPHPEKSGKWERVGDDEIQKAIDQTSEYYDPKKVTDGGGAVATPDATQPEATDSDNSGEWEEVRSLYKQASQKHSDMRKNDARFEAAEALLSEYHFANREDDDVLYVYNEETGVYEDNGESVIRQRTRKKLKGAFARQEVGELAEHIRAAQTYAVEEFGGPEWHINVTNGVLRIDREGNTELLEHNPDYLFVNQAGTKYDRSADCPRWRQYLKESVKSETHRMKLQEYAGYCLMHWALPEHKALFLVGPQASGKSTFADTIRAMLGGAENVASMSLQEMTARFGTAEMFEAWSNIRNDIPADTIEETGTFKEITAGDPIKAERKGKPLFHFRPTAKHIFSANQLPDAEEDDGAFYRRILLVPFPTTIPRNERDKQLDEKLEDELPGILNWALDGLSRLLKQNGFTGDLSVHETAETWDKWGHTVDRFAKACLEGSVDGTPKKKSEVYQMYQRFCDSENFPAETQRQMTRRLKTEHSIEDGRATINGRQERCFLNLEYTPRAEQYKTDDDDDDETTGRGLDDYS